MQVSFFVLLGIEKRDFRGIMYVFSLYNKMIIFSIQQNDHILTAARVAQWLECQAQKYDDPCVGGSNPTVGRKYRSFG
jgi:hypothetical protein